MARPIKAWNRLRWVFLWVLLILLISTYIADIWSIQLQKTIIDGATRYQVKARLNLGSRNVVYPVDLDAPTPDPKTSNEQVANSHIDIDKHPPQATQKQLPPSEKLTTTAAAAITTKTKATTTLPVTKQSLIAVVDDVPSVVVKGADCRGLFANDQTAIRQATEFQEKNRKIVVPDNLIGEKAKDCDRFRRERKYIMKPTNQEEADFPIAYSLVMFKDVEMVERLLRSIYRPQNYYCIHIDSKAKADIRDAMVAIANCFDNVFLSSRSVDVQWAWFSVLEPELICMQDLWKYPKWRYFINLTGQEFPLKTNSELVKILKAYNGANDLESTAKRRNPARTQFVHTGYSATGERKAPLTVNVTLSKGSVHIAVQRGYVDFVLHDKQALMFREWVKNTGVPDETFFSSLNISPQLGVPGSRTGDKETNKDTNPFLTRFKNWGTWPFDFPCAGQRVRMVCIFSIGDLPLLASRPEMFANKFYPDYHPLAYDCMEQRHYNRTRNEILGNTYFHDELYKQFEFVHHHI